MTTVDTNTRARTRARAGTRLLFIALLALLPCATPAAVEPSPQPLHRLGIAYPDMREPFRSIFESIITGIAEQSGVPVIRLALDADADAEVAGRWLKDNRVDAVICLGNRAREVMTSLKNRVPMVIGGVLSSPELQQEGWHGVVLNPNPASLFEQLVQFVPNVRRVHVVYAKESDDWLMDSAVRAANERGIVLVKHLVWTPFEAAQTFRRLIGGMDGRSEAIWLLQNQTVIGIDSLLPFILKQSWDHSVPVFSSTPNHVRQGALFSVFPDHRAMGRRLVQRLDEIRVNSVDPAPPLEAATEVKLVANLRTLEHLDIKLTAEERDRIELTFPDR